MHCTKTNLAKISRRRLKNLAEDAFKCLEEDVFEMSLKRVEKTSKRRLLDFLKFTE